MKTILIVGYGSSKRRSIFEHVRQIAKELMIQKIVCLHESVAEWLEKSKLIDEWILVPQFQQNRLACIEQIDTFLCLHSMQKFDAILTFDEDCVVLSNFLGMHFGNVSPCPSEDAMHQIKDKYLFRLKCLQHRAYHKFDDKMQPIPSLKESNIGYIPFFETVPNLIANNFSTLPNCEKGFILKPRIGAGKVTIQKFPTKEHLQTFLISKQTNWDNYMIEEFFDGNEVDLDCLVQNKVVQFIGISDNNPPLQDPFLQETGGNTPSLLPHCVQNQLKQMATELISWMEIENGCLHLEAKTNGKMCMSIEINMRLGGAETFAMVYNGYQVDLIKHALEIALGQPITISSENTTGPLVVSHNFHSKQSGMIHKFENRIHECEETRVKELVLFKRKGDSLKVPPGGFDSCYGWIVVSSKEPFVCSDQTKTLQILSETKSHLQLLCSKIELEIL